MANEQNLAPRLSDTDNSQIQAERGRKGGSAITERKKDAARLREFKKMLRSGKKECDNPKWLLDKIENNKAFAVELLLDLDKLERQPEYPLDKLIFLKNQIYKSLHSNPKNQINISGTMPMVNIQINIPEEVKKYL